MTEKFPPLPDIPSIVDPKTIKPTFPWVQKITSKVCAEVYGILVKWVREQGYMYIYNEEKINILLNMEWLSDIKIKQIIDLGCEPVLIKVECKAKKEFIKTIKRKIVENKVTSDIKKLRWYSSWDWFKELRILLYWASVQILLKIYEED